MEAETQSAELIPSPPPERQALIRALAASGLERVPALTIAVALDALRDDLEKLRAEVAGLKSALAEKAG